MRLPAYLGRLAAVTVAAVVADQLTKFGARAIFPVGEHLDVALGFGLGRLQHTGIRSESATVAVAVVFVLAGLMGARSTGKPSARIKYIAGGLLLGGALSSFVERVIVGSTTDWLRLPLGATISLAYVEMLVGAAGLFFAVGQTRRHHHTIRS